MKTDKIVLQCGTLSVMVKNCDGALWIGVNGEFAEAAEAKLARAIVGMSKQEVNDFLELRKAVADRLKQKIQQEERAALAGIRWFAYEQYLLPIAQFRLAYIALLSV